MTSRAPVANRPTDTELRRLYLGEHLSCAAIARPLGCDPTTVRHWLVAAEIPLRARGHNNRFEPGQPSAFAGRKHTPEALAKIEAATRARGGVPYLRQGQHWLKGAAPEMNPRWLGGITPERQAFYASREWKEACKLVWARADACCERCDADSRLVERTAGLFHVHHVVSFKVAELRAEPKNLTVLCRDCHLWVHSSANVERALIAADEAELDAMIRDSLRYLMAAEFEARQPTLFDVLDVEAEAA